MKVKIIIDSTTNVKKELMGQFGVVPLTVHFGDREYVDGVTINYIEFYKKLENENILPTTSQPTPDAFENAFRTAVNDGCKVVAITVASKLSGTYQSACIAAEEFGDDVIVVDSESVAIGAGILAETALGLAKQGKSATEIADILNEEKKKIKIFAVLDTLEYLKKGGRVNAAVAIAGGMLNIKPVAAIEKGEIKMAGKARGNKLGNAVMLQQINGTGGIDFSKPFLLGYTGTEDLLLKEFIAENRSYFNGNTINQSFVGSVVGTHAGPGAIAVAYYTNQ